MKDYDLILGGDAYNSRTKGGITIFLKELIGESNFIVLGNGNSFTGFALYDLSDENAEEIKTFLSTKKFPETITFEQQ